MKPRHTDLPGDCRAVSDVLARIGDKWSVLVVTRLGEKSLRFNELRGEEAAGVKPYFTVGSKCFCTLPSALRGSLSTTMNDRGTLNDASFSRHCASRSCGSIVRVVTT